MKKEIISITGYKGAVLHGILWTPDEEPKVFASRGRQRMCNAGEKDDQGVDLGEGGKIK